MYPWVYSENIRFANNRNEPLTLQGTKLQDWATIGATVTATPLVISFGGSYPSIKLQNNSKGKPLIHLGQYNYRYFAASAWTTLKDGQWHHVAFTVPGKEQADVNQAMMYLDGAAVTGDAPGGLAFVFPILPIF